MLSRELNPDCVYEVVMSITISVYPGLHVTIILSSFLAKTGDNFGGASLGFREFEGVSSFVDCIVSFEGVVGGLPPSLSLVGLFPAT